MYNYAILDIGCGIMTDNNLELYKKNILFTTNRPDLIMHHGEKAYLWDTDSKKYLDFIGGWAVTSLGHCPQVIIEALNKQANLLINASPAFYNEPMLEFAGMLSNISCFSRVFFASSGAEANEGAIKLARKYGSMSLNGAYGIITTINAFHGRTLATMSASGKKYWEHLYEPKVSGFKHVPFNDIDAMSSAIDDNTCAIMLEPIQGEGGVHVSDNDYIVKLRKMCTDKKILLIFDEVQTGIGRTGKMFAYEHYGIEPDVITLAKGLGGGFPLAALMVKEDYNIFESGDQGGTYSGQPLAMAAGLSVVKEIVDKDICNNVIRMEAYIRMHFERIKDKYNLKNIRGKGLLLAFDLPIEKGSELVSDCMSSGLLINSPQPSTIRLMPPLTIGEDEVDEMITIICKSMDSILSQ